MNNAIKWGAIMAVGLIILSLAMHYSGMSEPENTVGGIINTVLSYVISVGAMVMGISAYKKSNSGFLTLGNGISQGVLIALIGGILMAIFTYIFYSFVATDAMDSIKEAAMAGAEETGGEQEEMVGNMLNAMFSPGSMAFMVVVMKLFLGLIVGLIAGLIMKNERPQGTL